MTTTKTTATAATTDTTQTGGQPDKSQTRIEIFTDGACIMRSGGYAGVILRKDASGKIIKKVAFSAPVTGTTNNRMEMTAACVALERLGPITAEPIAVFCDASLIPNAMNEWLPNWKARGWKKAKGGAVENRDLWERLEAAAAGRAVSWHWVRGHNGTRHNEEADKLAYAAAREAEEISKG